MSGASAEGGGTVISLEGLPGAGKSTTARALGERLGVAHLEEATRHNPYLDEVYVPGRFDLPVELAFLLLHFRAWQRIDRSRVTVCDFSPVKDRLFALDTLQGNDLELFESVFARLYLEVPAQADVVVFLDVPSKECLARARRRGRPQEALMDVERLDGLRALYLEHLDALVVRVERVAGGAGVGVEAVVDRVIDVLREAGAVLG